VISGADLHLHEGAALDIHWLIKNATYDPHCFVCTNRSSGFLEFHFFDSPPPSHNTGWFNCLLFVLSSTDYAIL